MQEVQGGRVGPAANINICVCRALRPQCPLCHVIDAFHFSSLFFLSKSVPRNVACSRQHSSSKTHSVFSKISRKEQFVMPRKSKKYSYFTLKVC